MISPGLTLLGVEQLINRRVILLEDRCFSIQTNNNCDKHNGELITCCRSLCQHWNRQQLQQANKQRTCNMYCGCVSQRCNEQPRELADYCRLLAQCELHIRCSLQALVLFVCCIVRFVIFPLRFQQTKHEANRRSSLKWTSAICCKLSCLSQVSCFSGVLFMCR